MARPTSGLEVPWRAVALTLLMAGCAASSAADLRPARSSAHAWGYQGPGAPEQWASLSPEYARCASGQFQSPIDLRPIARAEVDVLQVDYRPDTLRIVNNGHTVQVNHRAPSTLTVGGHPFRLLQYHLHSPSEHTESGRPHALELHLVHRDEMGNYAVLAVFIDAGDDTGDEELWRHLPTVSDGNEYVYEGERVNPAHLLPSSLVHYQYHGSLTTPPCTETVTWNVLATPITLSAEHIAAFRRLYLANARPVQPRAGSCLAPHAIGAMDGKSIVPSSNNQTESR